jgi:[ribosomal protein S5]-alanine N-acetyltransferase
VRVFLRTPLTSDRSEYLRLTLASRAGHRGWVSPPTTRNQFDAFLTRAREDDFEALVVIRGTDNALVGAFNFSQISYGPFCILAIGSALRSRARATCARGWR